DTGILENVIAQPEIYIDGGTIFLKLDKQVLYSQKKLVLGGKDTISVHLCVGSRSAKREEIVKYVKKFIEGEMDG
ncbi:MAG: hypothetical protein ACPL1Y_06665, partial [Thermoplasmata archaeon]